MVKTTLVGRFKGKTSRLACGKLLFTMEFEIPENANLIMEEAQDDWLAITFEEAKRKRKLQRSLSANAYAWVLIGELAEKQKLTKEEVYRKEVSEAGVYDVIRLKNEAVNMFTAQWKTKGLGFFTEVITANEEETELIVYYGSHVYDTKQMSRLIDNIVSDCKEVGIPVMTDREIALLKEDWRNYEY